MIAFGFISSSSSLPIMCRVESFSGTCSDTMSEVRSSSRSRRNFTPCASASPSESRAMSKYCTCMPNGLRQPRDLLADGAEADDAERLVVQLVHARRRPVAAPAPAGHAGMLPDHFAADREHQHQRVLGHRDRVRAAIVRERHFRAPRGLEVDIVVAGAEQLHQPELRHRLVELILHRDVRIGDHVFDAGKVGDDLGIVVDDHGFETLRRHLARDVGDLGGGTRNENFGGHCCSLRKAGTVRHRARESDSEIGGAAGHRPDFRCAQSAYRSQNTAGPR